MNKRKMANRPKITTFTIITKTQIKVTAFPLHPGATFVRKKYTALEGGHSMGTSTHCG